MRRRMHYSDVVSPTIKRGGSYSAPASPSHSNEHRWKETLPFHKNRNAGQEMLRVTSTRIDEATSVIKRMIGSKSGSFVKQAERRFGRKITSNQAGALCIVLLLCFCTVYLFVSMVADLTRTLTSGSSSTEFGRWSLTLKETRALDKLIVEVFEHSVSEDTVKMEETLHRATQRYCVPYLSERFKLDHKALGTLEAELAVLIDMVASHRVTLNDLNEEHTIVVEPHGKISFVDDWEWKDHKHSSTSAGECPLVSELYELTRGNIHVQLPSKASGGGGGGAAKQQSVSATQFIAKIDDDNGVVHSDMAAIVMTVTDLLSANGECASAGTLLQLSDSAAEMKATHNLKHVFEQVASFVNVGDGKILPGVWLDKFGNVFSQVIEAAVKERRTEWAHCNALSTAFATLYKERSHERIRVAALSLLARLWNMDDSDRVADLLANSELEAWTAKKTTEKKTSFFEAQTSATANQAVNNNDFGHHEKWSVAETAQWIGRVTQSAECELTFVKNNVSGALLKELSEEVLKNEFGVTNWGQRAAILKAIKDL